MPHKIFYIFLILFSYTLNAQDSIEEILPNNIISFRFSNDFVFETDQYYTNGFRFEFYFPFLKYNPINYILLPATDNSIIRYGLSATQDLYTPTEVKDTALQIADRPFAAYILIGSKKVSYDKSAQLKILSELELGIIGESAMGRQIQNGIHDMLPASDPVFGWANQIRDDFCINYTAEIEKGFWNNNWLIVNGIASTKLGSPFTYLDAGATMRIGKFDNDYHPDFAMTSNMDWQGYFFADLRGRYVLFNATLQGGLLNDDSYYTVDDINNWLADLVFGATFIYHYFQLDAGAHFQTPEFPSAKKHMFGYMNIRVGF